MDINKEKDGEFKYVRLIVPIELHTKIIRYQAMKILNEDKKESLSTCILELLQYATHEIKTNHWEQ
jgi:hypothetical protein